MDFLKPKKTKRAIKDVHKRNQYANHELYKNVLKSIAGDETLSSQIRTLSALQLFKKKGRGSITTIRNRCVVSGRAQAVYSKFRMSRIVLRQMAASGRIPNIVKKSW